MLKDMPQRLIAVCWVTSLLCATAWMAYVGMNQNWGRSVQWVPALVIIAIMPLWGTNKKCLGMFCLIVACCFLGWYGATSFHTDRFIHCICSGAITIIMWEILRVQLSSPLLATIIAPLVVISAGCLLEIAEAIVTWGQNDLYRWHDTILDLSMNTLGASIAGCYCLGIAWRHRRQS